MGAEVNFNMEVPVGETHKKLAESFVSGIPCKPEELAGIDMLGDSGIALVADELSEPARSRALILLSLADTFAPDRALTIVGQIRKALKEGGEPELTDQEAAVLNAYTNAAFGRQIDDSASLIGRENKDTGDDSAKKPVASSRSSGRVIDVLAPKTRVSRKDRRKNNDENDEDDPTEEESPPEVVVAVKPDPALQLAEGIEKWKRGFASILPELTERVLSDPEWPEIRQKVFALRKKVRQHDPGATLTWIAFANTMRDEHSAVPADVRKAALALGTALGAGFDIDRTQTQAFRIAFRILLGLPAVDEPVI